MLLLEKQGAQLAVPHGANFKIEKLTWLKLPKLGNECSGTCCEAQEMVLGSLFVARVPSSQAWELLWV